MRTLAQRVRASLLARFGPRFDRQFEELKAPLFRDVGGIVVEIGPGIGSNIRYIPGAANWIGIEPNSFMKRHLLNALHDRPNFGMIIEGCAEDLPLRNESIDIVVSTLVLCSVTNPLRALAEIERVLKPHGQLIFIEHTAAQPGSWLRTMQEIASPIYKVLCDGCRPNRNVKQFVLSNRFDVCEYKEIGLRGIISLNSQYILGRVSKRKYREPSAVRHCASGVGMI